MWLTLSGLVRSIFWSQNSLGAMPLLKMSKSMKNKNWMLPENFFKFHMGDGGARKVSHSLMVGLSLYVEALPFKQHPSAQVCISKGHFIFNIKTYRGGVVGV